MEKRKKTGYGSETQAVSVDGVPTLGKSAYLPGGILWPCLVPGYRSGPGLCHGLRWPGVFLRGNCGSRKQGNQLLPVPVLTLSVPLSARLHHVATHAYLCWAVTGSCNAGSIAHLRTKLAFDLSFLGHLIGVLCLLSWMSAWVRDLLPCPPWGPHGGSQPYCLSSSTGFMETSPLAGLHPSTLYTHIALRLSSRPPTVVRIPAQCDWKFHLSQPSSWSTLGLVKDTSYL
jgi:hypothetical protein